MNFQILILKFSEKSQKNLKICITLIKFKKRVHAYINT